VGARAAVVSGRARDLPQSQRRSHPLQLTPCFERQSQLAATVSVPDLGRVVVIQSHAHPIGAPKGIAVYSDWAGTEPRFALRAADERESGHEA
jgi:hypothetical protein